MLPVVVGWALAFRIRNEPRVAVGWFGDGASAKGDCHEAMNFAGARRLPVVFVCDNNQFAYSTPNHVEFGCERLVDRGPAYGFEGVSVDGTDVLAVYREAKQAIEKARAGGGPTLIESVTLRMEGHAVHDDAFYVPKEMLSAWAERDPVERYRDWLLPTLPDSVRTRFDGLAPADPLVYSDSFPDAWDRFRRLQITELVERIYHGVKKRNPRLIVSAAVFGDADNAYRLRFQDWRDWLRRDIIDVACPMAYTDSTELFRERIRTAVETAGGARGWAGIAAYKNTVDGTVEQIGVARGLGAAGVVLFSYDFMARQGGMRPGESYLLAVRDRAFR